MVLAERERNDFVVAVVPEEEARLAAQTMPLWGFVVGLGVERNYRYLRTIK